MPLAMRPGWALQTWGKAHSSRPSAPEGPPCPWGALCAGRGSFPRRDGHSHDAQRRHHWGLCCKQEQEVQSPGKD